MTDLNQHNAAVHEIAKEVDPLVTDTNIRVRFADHIDRFCEMVEGYSQALKSYEERLQEYEEQTGRMPRHDL